MHLPVTKEAYPSTHLPVTVGDGAQVFLDPRKGPGYQERQRTVLSTFACVPNFLCKTPLQRRWSAEGPESRGDA